MKTRKMTPNQIREAGLAVLQKELGPVGTLRFLQQFETGQGDYTTERHQILGRPNLEDLVKEIKKKRRRTKRPQKK